MMLESLTVGPMAANCYIIADPASKEAAVIDPGGDPSKIRRSLKKNGLKLKFVINTHGHGDHIGANAQLGVPVYIHRLDADFLGDPKKNLSQVFLFSIKSPKAARLLEDGDAIKLGSITLEVIHTPGHTPGSICLKTDSVIFTGDTLFRAGVGRTDLPGSDESALFRSIRERLFAFGDDTVIYPGHGEPSTIGDEKRDNPFFE
jgi:glyoxylase-like metal-dependent hydrolase (beta-lactamase superfamily II)